MPDGNNVNLKINIEADNKVSSSADSATKSLDTLEKQAKATENVLSRLTKEFRVHVDTRTAVKELAMFRTQAKAVLGNSTMMGRKGSSGRDINESLAQFKSASKTPDLSNISGAVTETTSSINEQTSAVEKLKNNYRGLTKEQGTASAKSKSWLSGMTSSLARIAKLRVLRGIIRSITQAISEGSKNIYEYSSAMGSTDASGFANKMNQVASAFLYVKNSIGAVIAPIMNTLSPVLTWIAEKFVAVANIVAQFFAALGGQSTYTRAKYVETAWQGVADSTGDATANAKEYKKTIMGFDELNVLDSQDNGGGGGSGGGGGGASDMFEEVPLETTGLAGLLNSLAKAIAPILAEIGKQIDGFVETSTGVLNGGIDVVVGHFTGNKEQVIKGFDEIQEAINKDNIFAKFARWTYTAWKDIADFFVKIKIGVLDVFIWITDKMSFLDPVLEALGVPTFKDANKRFREMRDHLEKNGDLASNMADNMERWANGEITSEEMLKKNSSLFQGMKELPQAFTNAWSTFKSGFERGVINPIKRGWEGIKGFVSKNVIESIKTAWKAVSSFVDKNVISPIKKAWGLFFDAIKKSIDSLKIVWEKIKTFVKDKVVEPIKNFFNGIKGSVEKNVTNPIKKLWKDVKDFVRDNVITPIKEFWQGVKDFIRDKVVAKVEELWEKIVGFVEKNVVKPIKETWQSITDFIRDNIVTPIEDLWEGIVGFVEKNVIAPIESAWEAVSGFVDKNVITPIAGFWNGLVGTISGVIESVKTAFQRAWNWIYWNIVKPFDDLLAGIKSVWDYLYGNNGQGINISVDYWDVGSIAGKIMKKDGGYVGGYAKGGIIPRFANGGVRSADIFAANENGVPELIGRIGNRPAVANQGQMVDALSEALYRGLSQMFNQESTNEVNVYMDSTRVARAVEKGKRTLNRRFNVSLV